MMTKKEQQMLEAAKRIVTLVVEYGFTGSEALDLFNKLVVAQQTTLAHLLRLEIDKKENNDGTNK